MNSYLPPGTTDSDISPQLYCAKCGQPVEDTADGEICQSCYDKRRQSQWIDHSLRIAALCVLTWGMFPPANYDPEAVEGRLAELEEELTWFTGDTYQSA